MNTITIHDVISNYGPAIHGDDIDATVDEWANAGFSDLSSDLVAAWCESKCFAPMAAHGLHEAGITPNQASRVIHHCGSTDTIAYWVSNGDLSIKEALELVAA